MMSVSVQALVYVALQTTRTPAGYIIGNPITDPSDYNYIVTFARVLALISDETYESLERNCGGKYYDEIDPGNTKCLKEFQPISGIQPDNTLEPLCPFASPKPHDHDILRESRSLNQT
ncbi:Peptidase S10, serine carboxypeptidase [Trema orientale]|uniref:Peptidase S10, serine carboxypeptidase n=1 Tax=Trema orientale TaxID=63057 RepID=A0A2P5G100_TREOI|nr:Peptidase S10, serine carboxypeptidase [Trema orientale]